MNDLTNAFQSFVSRYNKSQSTDKPTSGDIERVQHELGVVFPEKYKEFIMSFGSVYTPEILDVIVDNKVEQHDIQEFKKTNDLVQLNKQYWSAGMPDEYVAFASDSMGNMFCFKRSDLATKTEDVKIYFFDHDFVKVSTAANSFVELLDSYNRLG